MLVGSVLFVCKANVCRSPVMEFVFSTALNRSYSATVRSAGTKAAVGAQICPVGRTVLSSRDAGSEFAARHRPASLEVLALAAQDLILVASREERAVVAQQFPEHRVRMFTVREALELGDTPVTVQERDWLDGLGRRSAMKRYALLLDRRRGTVNLDAERGRFPWSKPRDRMDISDVHQRGSREHLSKITRLADVVDDLAAGAAARIDELTAPAIR